MSLCVSFGPQPWISHAVWQQSTSPTPKPCCCGSRPSLLWTDMSSLTAQTVVTQLRLSFIILEGRLIQAIQTKTIEQWVSIVYFVLCQWLQWWKGCLGTLWSLRWAPLHPPPYTPLKSMQSERRPRVLQPPQSSPQVRWTLTHLCTQTPHDICILIEENILLV